MTLSAFLYLTLFSLYSYSILLWEILTLKEPFVGLMIHEYTKKVVLEGKRPKLDKKIPIELHELLSSGWESEPARRPCKKIIHQSLLSLKEDYNGKVANIATNALNSLL